MRKFWLIFKREYLTRVRSKGFIVATLGIPLLSIGLFGFSIFMATRQTDHTLKIAILDEAGGLAASIAKGLERKLPNGHPAFELVKTLDRPDAEEKTREELRREVMDGQLDGYLVIPRLGRDASSEKTAEFHTQNPGDFTLTPSIARAVSDAVIARRLGDLGVPAEKLSSAVRAMELKVVKVSKQGEVEEKGQTFLTAIMAAMFLYTTLAMYGIVTMRSVLEEKTTRIVEVLISAVRPFQLLAGKIVGVGAVAFTQYFIWISTAVLVTTYGATAAAVFRPGASAPHIRIPPLLLIFLAVYFLLGYLLYASIYAAVGAASSNEQDAQQLQLAATLPLVVGIVMFNLILRDPNSTASVALSEIPFFAPIIMLLRIAIQTPPAWQVALSIALLLLTTLGVVYFSARIYRVGVLMYGKRPSVVEILRWIRYT